MIRTPDRRLRVFISSTLGELADERRAVARAVSALRLTPVMFETGARPHPPRDVYRAYLAQSDVFVGLYWQQYGQVPPGGVVSALEEEFDLSAGMPRLLYVKGPAPEREPGLAALLSRIRLESSYRHFRTAGELGRLVRDDVAVLLSDRFAVTRSPVAPARAGRGPRPLPVEPTPLIGREEDVDEVVGLVDDPGVRLVTLTGPGGVGKTRLALAVAERLRDRFEAGTAFVPLDAVTQPELVLAAIARAVGADLGARLALPALVDLLGEGRWLLVLDNLEQVVEAARDLDELLTRRPGLSLLATSRTALRLRAEWEYPVTPLLLPADPAEVPVGELAAAPAVALFVDRARAIRHDFALTEDNAAAVVEICQRLEGLPLAIELAAARIRILEPDALRDRLSRSLDALGTGLADLPERQQTLRATVEWSVALLDDDERSLLETLAVFVGGWTVEEAAQVAGLDDDTALELSEALVRTSLVHVDLDGRGARSRMLETVRAFMAERLAARSDAAEVGRRHADCYRALAEQADRPLRGFDRGAWVERLEVEAGNMATAVRWYLAHDPAPLPHLFRVLLPLWTQQAHIVTEARGWILQLLPDADSLDTLSRAEVLWAATVAGMEAGDDATALSNRDRLASLLPKVVDDRYLHAVASLAVAWVSGTVGNFDGGLPMASAALDELRGQDEPLWTALALLAVGAGEVALGRHDDAQRHLAELRGLADRFDDAWLAAAARVQLGFLSAARGRPAEARALLDEALGLSLPAHLTRTALLALVGSSELAFGEGDPERAALLAGAAEGMRARAGLRVWPAIGRAQAQLADRLRQALGADRFDRAFTAGTRLPEREFVATARPSLASAVTRPTRE